MTRLRLISLLLFAGLLTACGEREAPLATLAGNTMGTSYQVQAVLPEVGPDGLPDSGPDEEPGSVPGTGAERDALARAIDAELAAIDLALSTWRDDSYASRFNRLPAGEWFAPPPRMAQVLQAAEQLSAQTGGALDLTLAALSRAWGFQGEALPAVPAPDKPDALDGLERPDKLAGSPALAAHAGLDELKLRTGMHLLEWSEDRSQLRKRVAGLALDFSALGKGYGVDRLVGVLQAAGVEQALVEIGGEVRALGKRPDGTPWRIALDLPRASGAAVNRDQPAKSEEAHDVIPLENRAVATSGDYRNYFIEDGARYAHVLDPATGRPAAYNTAAATVLAADAMTADALATAFMAMPPALALDLAGQLGVELLLVTRGPDGGLDRSWTPGFPISR